MVDSGWYKSVLAFYFGYHPLIGYDTHLMWFGPGVQVVAHVPVAGPTKKKYIIFTGNWEVCFYNIYYTPLRKRFKD